MNAVHHIAQTIHIQIGRMVSALATLPAAAARLADEVGRRLRRLAPVEAANAPAPRLANGEQVVRQAGWGVDWNATPEQFRAARATFNAAGQAHAAATDNAQRGAARQALADVALDGHLPLPVPLANRLGDHALPAARLPEVMRDSRRVVDSWARVIQ